MDEPQILRVAVTEEQIRTMARGDRDFVLRVTEDGDVTARCKACSEDLEIAGDGPLIWFRCPACDRVSFSPVGNVQRDMELARKDGRPFVSELHYFEKLPPSLRPPFGDGADEAGPRTDLQSPPP